MLPVPFRITCFAAALLAASTANAADAQDDDNKSYSWGLGVAGISQQLSYTGIDRDNMVVPLIYFENRWVELSGPFLDFKAPSIQWSDEQELSFTGRINFFATNGYEAGDAPILNGMAERKAGIFAGPTATWSNPLANVSLEWLLDASGESKGQTIKLGLEHAFQAGNHFMFTPSVAATWLDKKFANYYYGVRDTEARAGRPAYAADSTMNLELSLRTDYLIDPRQAVFVSLEYTALGSELKDSPLTERSNETQVFAGYLYRF